MHAGVEAIGGEESHTRRGRVWARGTAFFPRATSSCGTTANFPDAILRAVADTDKDCVGSLYIVASARRGNGDRAWGFFLVSPVFAGAGAILWFVLGSAPAELRMVAWFAAFAVVALMAGPGRRLIRNLALAGLLCVTGMFAAQFETWSKATIILDSGDDDDHRPCRAPGRRWPWPVALHRLRLIDAIARDKAAT